jgi:flavin reductase (DIM6/NTAB) family NADH-FMN oxidoreductase RutF
MTTDLSEEQLDLFDRLVAQGDGPMVIVTVAAGDERAGCLVGFHTQCSIEPRRYSLWLSKANRTYRVALRADLVACHLLSEDQADLARWFGGQTGDDVDKFEGIAVDDGPEGLPLLRGCPDRFVLRRTSLVDEGGDHVCLVGEPVEVHGSGGHRPLRLQDVDDIEPGHEADERPEGSS